MEIIDLTDIPNNEYIRKIIAGALNEPEPAEPIRKVKLERTNKSLFPGNPELLSHLYSQLFKRLFSHLSEISPDFVTRA
jgi:hypothetical protein